MDESEGEEEAGAFSVAACGWQEDWTSYVFGSMSIESPIYVLGMLIHAFSRLVSFAALCASLDMQYDSTATLLSSTFNNRAMDRTHPRRQVSKV